MPSNCAAARLPDDGIFGGTDYLLIRTHFSQGIGYVDATGAVVNGLPTQSVASREINFPYTSAFRTYLGYNFTPTAALQFTYFHLDNSANLSGTPSAPNHTLTDAYGDVAHFGQTMGGKSSVRLNVFDLDFVGRYAAGRQLSLRPAAGVRWADVKQHNDSSVTDPLAGIIGTGTFNTHFTGFGPHGSLLAQARIRPNSPFSLVARGAGSLLIGGYSVTSGAVFTGVAAGDQTAHRTLTVPVLEAELGGDLAADRKPDVLGRLAMASLVRPGRIGRHHLQRKIRRNRFSQYHVVRRAVSQRHVPLLTFRRPLFGLPRFCRRQYSPYHRRGALCKESRTEIILSAV